MDVQSIFFLVALVLCQSHSLNLQPKRALWRWISDQARASIVNRARSIGVDFEANVELLRSNIGALEKEYDQFLNDPRAPREIPDYYLKEFHAYEEGNLSWEAAMEVESAALAVHAPIFTGSNKVLRRDGDDTLRQSYHDKMVEALGEDFEVSRIVDVGSSTGLSTNKLAETFPTAQSITGIDLSPYMLAVAALQNTDPRIDYVYGSGESMAPFLSGTVDLVSMCLVSHELPQNAAVDIYSEVFNIMKSGGAFSIMDIDPDSEFFRKFRGNRFAYAGFKSTEPWLDEYCSMDLVSRLKCAGFRDISVAANSPRHRTVVAIKP